MRKYLFEEIHEVVPYFAFQDTVQMADLLPTLKMVESTYLRADVDGATYSAVLAAIDATAPSAELKELSERMRQAAAYLLAYEHMDKANVMYTTSGLLVSNHQGTVPASEFRTLQLRAQLLRDSQRALDQVVRYLEDNTAIFTDWAASAQATSRELLLIRSAAEMNGYYAIHENEWLFRKLIPWQRTVIDIELTAMVGTEIVTDLLEKIANGSMNQLYQLLLRKAATATALLTVAKALPQLQIAFGPEGVAILDSDYNYKGGRRQADDLGRVRYLVDSLNDRGHTQLRALKGWLDATSNSTTFPAYFSSSSYTDPNVNLADTNDTDRPNLLSL